MTAHDNQPDARAGADDASRETPLADACESFNALTAQFADLRTETAYQNHLSGAASNRERLLQVLGILLFLSYGMLDFLVVKERAAEFLALRFLIVAPAVGVGVAITSLKRFRRHIQYSTTLGFAAFSGAIVYMIYRMPGDGAPPYIIGLLVVMIFTSCLMHVNFFVAAPVFAVIAASYCVVLVAPGGLPTTEIVSGYFFMISVAAVAIVTNYLQERRSRENWIRNVQRELDSKRIEQLLVEATAADRSKLNFLSVLTHELRTPLHQIIGFSEVARNQVATGDTAAMIAPLAQISQSARELLKKLSQMLRYADATAGRVEFQIDDIQIAEIIDQLKDQFAGASSAKAISITAQRLTPAVLPIDQHHTAYALSNLIENALNASGPGSQIELSGEPLDGCRYRLQVADHGCGMSAEKIAAAFAPFEQTDQGRTRSREGVGLGLTIAKLLLNGQGATLTLQSTPGVGTTASIVFTAGKAPTNSASEERPAALSRSA